MMSYVALPFTWYDVDVTGRTIHAGVAKLGDALDLGSNAARRGGSSPSTRTNNS